MSETRRLESKNLSKEEEDLLRRNTKKIKSGQEDHAVNVRSRVSYEDIGRDSDPFEYHPLGEEDNQRKSYMDSLLHRQGNERGGLVSLEGNVNVEEGNANTERDSDGILISRSEGEDSAQDYVDAHNAARTESKTKDTPDSEFENFQPNEKPQKENRNWKQNRSSAELMKPLRIGKKEDASA
ncbi:uncharacterized protein G2W53_007510 [Senna tora]|uniref:Uncharacterized protein n=1 Tax=Senna tora TaxID=362788 RepID=A0A834X6E8_9FABA|nr:uncharacterized protein G2W53_007510 [Senna tora]